MNGFLLIIPLFLIRFGLLGLLNRDAVKKAAHFAPVRGPEKAAVVFYQISNILIFLYPLALNIHTPAPLFFAALAVYALGMVLLTVAVIGFARPGRSGIRMDGVYRFSRNPMYVGYFVYFLGCVLLTRSFVLFAILLVFQVCTHFIIRSEERWCVQQFGEEYTRYMEKVRRYL